MRYFLIALFSILPLLLITACSEDDPVTPQVDHFEAIGVVLYQGGDVVAAILRGETSDTLDAAENETGEITVVRFYDEDENIVEAHADEVTFSWEIADTSIAEVLQDSGEEGAFEFRLRGKQAGTTTIEFFILHEGHADFRSGKLTLVVR
jgi:hypothetical protein